MKISDCFVFFVMVLSIICGTLASADSYYSSEESFSGVNESKAEYLEFLKLHGRTTCDDNGTAICVTQNGGFAACNLTRPSGDLTIRIERYFASGEIDYAFEIGDSGNDAMFDISELSDGKLLGAGLTQYQGSTGEDALLTQFLTSPFIMWNKIVGGSEDDVFYGLTVTPGDDASLAVGYTNSFGSGSKDAFLVRPYLKTNLA
ncbi:hypothetical protein K8T06_09365 [bacterium]|nr:hypothetical protein [bacterium]